MKRTLLIIAALAMLIAPAAHAANFYPATALVGGTTGALDKISGAALAQGDTAVVSLIDDVTYGTTMLFYVLDATSAATEDVPHVISPDSNAGDKRWVLAGIWVDGYSVAKQTGVAGAYSLTTANGDDLYYTGMMGPPAATSSFSHQYPNDQPAGSVYVWGTPSGTGDPNGNPVSAGTLKAAPSGDLVGTTDSQTLTNKDMSGAGNTWPTFNQDTTGSAAKMSILTQTGELSFTGITSTDRTKTLRDADDTILELGGSYTPTGTWNLASATITNPPTWNQDTTGNAATATAADAASEVNSGGTGSAFKIFVSSNCAGETGMSEGDLCFEY